VFARDAQHGHGPARLMGSSYLSRSHVVLCLVFLRLTRLSFFFLKKNHGCQVTPERLVVKVWNFRLGVAVFSGNSRDDSRVNYQWERPVKRCRRWERRFEREKKDAMISAGSGGNRSEQHHIFS
jgi:hypothetical protein